MPRIPAAPAGWASAWYKRARSPSPVVMIAVNWPTTAGCFERSPAPHLVRTWARILTSDLCNTRHMSVMLTNPVTPNRHPQSAVALRIPRPGLRFAGWQ
jgi:hypothetical protein